MNIYYGIRKSGKTTRLIKLSAKTGSTIAVGNYTMANYIEYKAQELGLEIPEPVLYSEIFTKGCPNDDKRYLVDDIELMLRQFNIDAATLDDDYLYDIDELEENECLEGE